MAKTSTSRKATEKQTEGTQAARSRVGRCPSKAKTPQKKSTRHDWENEPENVLDSLAIIGAEIRGCRHHNTNQGMFDACEHCEKHFNYIHTAIGLDKMEIIFLAAILYVYDGYTTNMHELGNYFGGSSVYILQHRQHIRNIMSLHDLESLYGNNSSLFDIARNQLKRGKHVLQEKGIVEYANQGEFVDTSEYKLTDKAKDELLTEYQDLIIEQSVKGLKHPCDITAKKLFYPTKTQNSIDELAGLLSEKQFVEVRNNLHNKGMRTGFACLFSGAPGTGKTETVLQLAKQTGRPLMGTSKNFSF